MYSGDLLGDEERKALDACVKVKIFGKPETRRYDYYKAHQMLKYCYAGNYPGGPWPFNRGWRGDYNKRPWLDPDDLLFPNVSVGSVCDITDVHHALVRFDDLHYVEKYPLSEGPRSDKLKALIDKRRVDVERECQEATANLNGRCRYSWLVAQRRVRDCFAGNFAGDASLLETFYLREPNGMYNIADIYDAFVKHNEFVISYRSNCTGDSDCGKCEKAFAQRAAIEAEYVEAVSYSGTTIKQGLRGYSRAEAEQKLDGCYRYCNRGRKWPVIRPRGELGKCEMYDIFDICKALCCRDEGILLHKYPSSGPGADELTKSINAHRDDLKKEFEEDKLKEYKYSRSEAEHRVRDCFAGNFLGDTDIFLSKEGESQVPKIYQTYDIFDIAKAIKYFDSKKLVEQYPEEDGPKSDEQRKMVDKQRAFIEREYIKATTDAEIEHGSGFVIQDHFIITNKHVIQTALDDKTKKTQILVSNAGIDEFPCEVACHHPKYDLALLCCPGLDLHGISPLKLSNQSLLPGMQIFSFGYPMSHTEETALFVNGYVSGSKKMLSGHTMAVLNCSLNSGNSGGPVLCWVKDQLKVVGVATQKHFKEILTLEESQTIEKLRETLQTVAIPEVSEFEESLKFDHYTKAIGNFSRTTLPLLTLKIYDSLETHAQYNLANALPGNLVVEFLKKCVREYKGDCSNELAEIVKVF